MTRPENADVRSLEASSLGATGPADPARCSLAAIEALSRVAGPGFAMTSLTLDVASHGMGEGEVSIRAHADKRTRSIVFASAEGWQGDRLVFSAQGLFSLRKAAA
jgi:acyl-coenzyme A thioesterase PaaI-like protein